MNKWWCDDGTFGAAYPALLLETYHYVRQSCALMLRARDRLDEDRRALRDYLRKHVREESGHERWLLNDLEALGFDIEPVSRSVPLPETIALVGSQQFVVEHMTPAGLLGYVYVMEATPPNAAFLAELRRTYAIPESAMTFLVRHGQEDVRHKQELAEVLDTLILPDESEAVVLSATMGLSCINRLMHRLRSGKFVSADPLPIDHDMRPQCSAIEVLRESGLISSKVS